MSTEEKRKLTKKQEMFCRYYVKNGHNGEKAAIEAGYSKRSAKTTASEILTYPNLKAFIEKLEKPVLDKLAIDEDWVLTKLKNFSDADITDFFEIKDNTISLKDFNKIPKEKIAAIESIKETKNGIEIKLVDKRSCTVDIGKHLGMFKELFEGDINHNLKGKVFVVPAFNNDVSSTKPTKG